MNIKDFKDFTRIVIVDDNFDEGIVLKQALQKDGVSSTFYNIRDVGDFPKTPFKNVRLVFLDFILESIAAGIAGDDAHAKHALTNLRRFVDKNSLYVLVIWTSVATAKEVVALEKLLRSSPSEIAKPFKVITLDKKDYDVKKEGTPDIDGIRIAIEDVFTDIPAFSIFSEGERLATNAIGGLVSNIVKESDNEHLSKTIYSLASAYSGGQDVVSKIPNNALVAFNGIIEDAISKKIINHDFGDHDFSGEALSDVDSAPLNSALMFTQDDSFGPGKFFSVTSPKIDHTEMITNIAEAKEHLQYVCIEVTPLCDSAHNKKIFTSVIHGILIPINNGAGTNFKPRSDFDHIYKVGNKNFYYKDKGAVYQLIVNLRSLETISNFDSLTPKNLKLRDGLVIDIQHKIASYISRPGHVLL